MLRDASLQINPKECVCIVGESASGKSTILKLLVREESPTSGTVEIDGVDLAIVPPPILQLYRRRTGIIFQEPILLDDATVREHLALPLELFGWPDAAITRNVDDILKRLGLQEISTRLPGQLSLSERSLVGIARALVTSPMVLLGDEPFALLDAEQAKRVLAAMAQLHKQGTTIILFSRRAETGEALHARTVHLKNGAFGHAAAEKKHAHASSEDSHRILEETEQSVRTILKEHETHRSSGSRGGHGKKIRITSIGSSL